MKKQLQICLCLIANLAFFSACVQEEHTKKVTFQVDMRNYDSIQNVSVRGQFTNPPWEVNVPMQDEDNDGVYEVTLEEQTGQSSVAFKFVRNENEFELACQPNRSIQFQYKPESILYSAVFDDPEGKQQLQ